MKVPGITILAAAVFTISAGEREDLLKTFEKENTAAQSELQEAMTTVAMTAAAGNLREVAQGQLLRALDWKLRHTPTEAERLRILSDFHQLSRQVQKVLDTPRQDLGSGAGMRICCAAANLMQRQTDIWLLDAESERRWRRIADAVLILNGKEKIGLTQGTASFETVMYERKVTLEAVLSPNDTFSFRGRDFAVIRTDQPFAGNSDFSNVYLCELKSGRLFIHTKCKFPFVSRRELRGRVFVFCGKTETQEIEL